MIASVLEDGMVALVVALALEHPVTALAIVLALLAVGAGLVFVIWSRIRRAWNNWKQRRGRAPPAPD